jgi:hypothetical protein
MTHPLSRTAAPLVGSALLMLMAGCVSSSQPADRTAERARASAVPSLTVQVSCNECEVKEGLPELIRTAYEARRTGLGAQTLADRATQAPAVLIIRSYAERGVVKRFLLGPAGIVFSDAIEAELQIRGQRIMISESARVPFQGIDAVARRIGEKALDAVVDAQPR